MVHRYLQLASLISVVSCADRLKQRRLQQKQRSQQKKLSLSALVMLTQKPLMMKRQSETAYSIQHLIVKLLTKLASLPESPLVLLTPAARKQPRQSQLHALILTLMAQMRRSQPTKLPQKLRLRPMSHLQQLGEQHC